MRYRYNREQYPERWPATFRHLLVVALRLRTGSPFNCRSLAAELDCDEKTIGRDIAMLRAHGWKIEYDPRAHEFSLRSAPRPRLI